jgi:hypothetical protein
MKKLNKENITQKQLDDMQKMIDMSLDVLFYIEKESRQFIMVPIGSPVRTAACHAIDFFYNNIKNIENKTRQF